MKAGDAEQEKPRLGPSDGAARKRAAVETYARHEPTLRRTARRYSLCADDAEDALQRGLEILLRKAPTDDPRELIKWMQTVVKHEALAVRRERERMLAGPAALFPDPDEDDWIALLPSGSDGPQEKVVRREAIARSREALQALKPQELRALTLLAEGYSYAEIGEITGYSQTKINRCLAEGRERFRKLIAGSEDGSRCAAMKPLLSAFCDGEAEPEQVAELREHLRACGHCRATLRAYRAAPGAAAAVAPTLPLDRSLLERVRDAFADLTARFGETGGAAAPSAAAGGGAGAATLAKVAAVCVATAGGATCVASGALPVGSGGERDPVPSVERIQAEAPVAAETGRVAAPASPSDRSRKEESRRPREQRSSQPKPQPAPAPQPVEAEPVSEPAPVTSSEPVEYVPPPAPEPVAEPAPVTSSSGGSPAGEFGP